MKEISRFTVRLPKELYEELKKQATENNRSLNSEIVYRLKNGCEK